MTQYALERKELVVRRMMEPIEISIPDLARETLDLRLSGMTISTTLPRKVNARTWEPIQSESCCVQVASA